MTEYKIEDGVFKIETHIFIKGRFQTNKNIFPIKKLAMTVQTKVGLSLNKRGPGTIPFTRKAPRIKAIVGVVGIPMVSKGIKVACTCALFAASGPAIPSTAPFPKRSGFLAILFSVEYERNEEIEGIIPGIRPRKKPMPDPRTIVPLTAFQSAFEGI